jgi:hypothetical protein
VGVLYRFTFGITRLEIGLHFPNLNCSIARFECNAENILCDFQSELEKFETITVHEYRGLDEAINDIKRGTIFCVFALKSNYSIEMEWIFSESTIAKDLDLKFLDLYADYTNLHWLLELEEKSKTVLRNVIQKITMNCDVNPFMHSFDLMHYEPLDELNFKEWNLQKSALTTLIIK